MPFLFTSSLSADQYKNILELYHLSDIASIEQHPGFATVNKGKDIRHYLQTDEAGVITAYAQISVRSYRIATISFGPLAISPEAFKAALCQIKKYCQRNLVPVLRVMPPYSITQYGEAYFEDLKATIPFETSDSEINWSTILIPLGPSEEELLKSFSENHRRSIKKAAKLGLRVEAARDQTTIEIFSTQRSQMYETRGLSTNAEEDKRYFARLFELFQSKDLGTFLMVYEQNVPVGGICCVKQGNAIRYFEGYSHPDYRQYPVTHIAFFEAIKMAKECGLKNFDLGGYANNVKEGDQLEAINRFKDGFKGELIHYPKTMMVFTFALAKWLYSMKKDGHKAD